MNNHHEDSHRHSKRWIGPKFQLPLPRAWLQEVSKAAEQAGVSRAEWIRRAVRKALDAA